MEKHRSFEQMLQQGVITCPWCWEPIEITLDLSVQAQAYTEDCSVCCSPISLQVATGIEGEPQIDVSREGD